MPVEAGALELTCARKALRQALTQRPMARAAHRVRRVRYSEVRSVRRQPCSRTEWEHADHRHMADRLQFRAPRGAEQTRWPYASPSACRPCWLDAT